MNLKYIADIHIHPDLKPFNSAVDQKSKKSIWVPVEDSCCYDCIPGLAKQVYEIHKSSQASLDMLRDSNTRLFFISLYPVERGFFKPRWIPFIFPRKSISSLAQCITGFGMSKLQRIRKRIADEKGVDYFKELKDEYGYILHQQEQCRDGRKFEIARDGDHLESILQDADKKLAVILSIEGAHAFGNFSEASDFKMSPGKLNDGKEYERMRQRFKKNISEMKKWGPGNDGTHCPLFITFCHHYWNLLCGHSKSFMGIMGFVMRQKFGMNEGFTKLGENVLHELLSKKNGRRVLIDIKHLSVKGRKQYYGILEDQYWANGDKVPVISSHSAVNGIPEFGKKPAFGRKYFSREPINLYDKEIKLIYKSEGLIGFLLHEGRMPGKKLKKVLKKLKKAKKKAEKNDDRQRVQEINDRLRDEYIRLLMANIFHVIRVVDDKSAWNIICLGSDFDGIMNPFDSYKDVFNYKDLSTHMFQFLTRPLPIAEAGLTVDKMKQLMFGYKPREIVEKAMYKNVQEFLKNNF